MSIDERLSLGNSQIGFQSGGDNQVFVCCVTFEALRTRVQSTLLFEVIVDRVLSFSSLFLFFLLAFALFGSENKNKSQNFK